MRQGIAYLPEDRKVDGIVGDLSVRDNIILAAQVLKGFGKPFSKAEAEAFADEYIKLLGGSDDNLLYGFGRQDDLHVNEDGYTVYAMYKMQIKTATGQLKKERE